MYNSYYSVYLGTDYDGGSTSKPYDDVVPYGNMRYKSSESFTISNGELTIPTSLNGTLFNFKYKVSYIMQMAGTGDSFVGEELLMQWYDNNGGQWHDIDGDSTTTFNKFANYELHSPDIMITKYGLTYHRIPVAITPNKYRVILRSYNGVPLRVLSNSIWYALSIDN